VTIPKLSRTAGYGRAAPPVRLVHLGLGNFFRAHQAWYTDRAPDAEEWGYAAFTGSSADLAKRLTAQDGLYMLVTRAVEGDAVEVISSLARAHAAAEHEAWLGYFASAALAVVTITVTEAGYVRGPDGGLAVHRPEIKADLETLRSDVTAPVSTAPARLVAGIVARRRADAGPLTLVPCDNVSDNAAIAERVVRDLAELVDPSLAGWFMDSVSVVATTVDRITPRTVADDVRTVAETTGLDDSSPVVTEPFTEWVLSGTFPAGRPRWEDSGATFTDDTRPFEHRKLWLLNGAHSLLAYAGSTRGHATVAEAVADDTCRSWVQEWWAEASPHLDQPADDVAAYRRALFERFANARIRHLLAQIAADGSQKLPIRILPVLRAERQAGRLPTGATRVLAGWTCHLRGIGAPVTDARADDVIPLAAGPLPDAVRRVLGALDPALSGDADLVETVVSQCEDLGSRWHDR
jgi:fructuronate reductase